MGQTVYSVGDERFGSRVAAAVEGLPSVDVVHRASLADARAALASAAVDCVVSDASLPDSEGMAIVEGLRETAPDVPVVLVPDEGSERLAVAALRTDGVEYVPSTATDRFQQVAARVAGFLEDRHPGDVRLESFKRAVEQAGHSIYITDTDGTIRYVNPAFEETTGYAAEQALGRTPRILKSGEHDAAFYEDLWRTILDGEVWRSELVNRRADGSRYVVNQTIAPIVVDGSIERFVAVNADITERKEREERLETLHDATREWLDVTTTDGVADRACAQLADLFDAETVCICCYDADEDELVPAARRGPDGDAEVPDACDCPLSVFEAGESRVVDRENGRPASELVLTAGDYGVARLTSSEPDAFDDSDVAVGRVFTSNLQAVLESVENYRALERQNERLDEFAGIVSHDLQNPLSVAMGFLDLLADRVGEDDDDLRRVRESLEHMEEIISDVLWLAAEGDRAAELEPVSLRRSAERSWSLVETDGATLTVDSEFRSEADPDLFHRLLENLFANAAEHAAPGVTVRVGALEDGAGFYVEDDGPGIPPDRREAVFDVGHTTSDDGTGFGLPIVKRIVEGHGWSVDVETGADGGARFVVRT